MEQLILGKDYSLVNGVLTINEGVKCIPEGMFKNRHDICAVVFPSTLEIIKQYAFACCSITGVVNIPDSVKYIHDYAFYSNEIGKLILGTSLIYIGRSAFETKKYMDIVNNSKNIEYIGQSAFITANPSDYAQYKSILPLENKLVNFCDFRNVDKYTFKDGVLKIRDGVENIGNFSDLKDSCTEIVMPDSVLFIHNSAFYNFSKLKRIRFSNNLLIISDFSFSHCNSIKDKIVLPDSLCKMNYNSFYNTDFSEKISVPYNTNIFILNDIQLDKYEVRDNPLENINSNQNRYTLDIAMLMEEERTLLDQLNLLPKTIQENRKIKNIICEEQINIIVDSLVKYISYKDYDEKAHIFYIKSLFDLKVMDISNMHDIVNILFNKGQMNTIYLFMSYGYDYFNNSMISRAILSNMYEMIDILLLLGTDINEIGTIDITPLSIACQKGDYKLVKKLIEKGAAINTTDKNNKTAIDYAKENNNYEIIDLINSYIVEESEIKSDLDAITKQLRNGG